MLIEKSTFKKKKIAYFPYLAILVVFLYSCESNNLINRGIFDINSIQQNGYSQLNGEWNFYWDQYIEFDSLGNLDLERKNTIKVPRKWNLLHDSLKTKAFGKAVYHIKVKNDKAQQLELRLLMPVTSAYRVFINNFEVYTSGNTGHDGNYKPSHDSPVIPFWVEDKDFDIYIEVANYSNRYGGIYSDVYLGKFPQLKNTKNRSLFFDLFVIFFIFGVSLYSLSVFVIDRKREVYLWYGLTLLFSTIRLVATSEFPIKMLFPDISFYMIDKMRYLGFSIGFAFGAKFLSVYFKDNSFVKLFMKIIIGIMALISVAFMVTPLWMGSYIITFNLFVSGVMMVYTCYLGLLHFFKADIYKAFTIGSFAFLIMLGHDALAANHLIPFHYWQQYAIFIVALFQILYLLTTYRNVKVRLAKFSDSLTEYGIINAQSNAKINELSEQLAQIKNKVNDSQSRTELDSIIKQVNQKTHLANKQRLALESLDQLHSNFMDNLIKSFPGLTKTDLELCLMIRADFSSNEIAEVRNITPKSVKMARSRLRKKLNIDGAQDIYAFLAQI